MSKRKRSKATRARECRENPEGESPDFAIGLLVGALVAGGIVSLAWWKMSSPPVASAALTAAPTTTV